MKSLFAIFFVFIMIVSGCSNVVDDTETEFKTIQQATLKSDIPLSEVFHTEEMDETAFSIYQTPNGYGILHFSLKEDGWDYQGRSGFMYSNVTDKKPFSFSQSTWHKGEISMDNESLYTTVFLGEVSDPEISNITVEYNNNQRDANLINNNERTYWYLISEQDDGNERVGVVSAYSTNGELLYQRGK
ncbi:hypothetical protein B4U37_16680 [Sutcliffiella horikoshii]|uniref:Lipoprotein n=1 Tax=Sutcliffiella horikoshii TaxID=79883 RepID=A0ABM6KLU4_9BACI|nr:hypothetical protein [Sutcliffiella horikoshii]ART77589.1 hypothetical protein B4U37_16680 [Sutcliffiella horikoshii]